jgi:nucleotide-binding universal stress UspA family protein
MSFSRILIATDFSDLAANATQRGLQLARQTGAEVVLLHVIENTWYPGTFGVGPLPLPDLEQQVRKAARERLDRLHQELAPSGLKCRTLLREGVPWAEIVSAAEQEHSDLIVLATHGYTGIKHALLGSQAERVVRTAKCAVMTIPGKAK